MAPNAPEVDVDQVKKALVETLGLEDRADSIGPETRLLGSLSEFDSLAVLELIVVLERRFAVTVADADVTAEVFETLESLTSFLREKVER